MTKGSKTLLFVLGATVVNILVTIVAFVLILVLYGLTLGRWLKISTASPVIIIAFLGSVVISAFVYKKVLNWAQKRWNLEEKLGYSKKK